MYVCINNVYVMCVMCVCVCVCININVMCGNINVILM